MWTPFPQQRKSRGIFFLQGQWEPYIPTSAGLTVAQVECYIEDEVQEHYLQMKAKYIELWDKVWYTNVSSTLFNPGGCNGWCWQSQCGSQSRFPSIPLPLCSMPTSPHSKVLKDYLGNKPFIMHELRSIVSDNSLAVDH